MQDFYDTQARHTDLVADGHDTDSRLNTDRRAHPDRRKRERRNSKSASKSSSSATLQPLLTHAEIAALLRGAR